MRYVQSQKNLLLIIGKSPQSLLCVESVLSAYQQLPQSRMFLGTVDDSDTSMNSNTQSYNHHWQKF